MSELAALKLHKRELIRQFARATDAQGAWQVAVTLLPLAAIAWLANRYAAQSAGAAVALTIALALMMVRVFALLHECGHGSVFRSRALNTGFGFIFGVLSGMPQYVWAQHHDYHHRTNGDWDSYRGPLSTLSVAEFEALPASAQRRYLRARHIALAPLGGFVYLLFNPRFTWLKGTLACALHLLRGQGLQAFNSRYWRSWREYRHMTANNLVLLSLWVLVATQAANPWTLFAVYLTGVSLAGGFAIALFTVQHNFEQAEANSRDRWDSDRSALSGTSYLVLPGWLNWLTANIGYHHVHHLSAAIPGYALARCHNQYQHLFTSVRRIRLHEIPAHLKCLQWDIDRQQIIAVNDQQRLRQSATFRQSAS